MSYHHTRSKNAAQTVEGTKSSANKPGRRNGSQRRSPHSPTLASSSSYADSSKATIPQQIRVEAPVPKGSVFLKLPGRDPDLPVILLVPNHVLVPSNHGRIYMLLVDYSAQAMNKLFEKVANQQTPANITEAVERGKECARNINCINDNQEFLFLNLMTMIF